MYFDVAGASPESLRPASTSGETTESAAAQPARKKFPEVILFQLYSRLLIESFVQFFIAELIPCFILLLWLMSFFLDPVYDDFPLDHDLRFFPWFSFQSEIFGLAFKCKHFSWYVSFNCFSQLVSFSSPLVPCASSFFHTTLGFHFELFWIWDFCPPLSWCS